MEPCSQLSNLEHLVLSPTTYEPHACQGMAAHTHTQQTHKDDYLGSPSWSFLIFFPVDSYWHKMFYVYFSAFIMMTGTFRWWL